MKLLEPALCILLLLKEKCGPEICVCLGDTNYFVVSLVVGFLFVCCKFFCFFTGI